MHATTRRLLAALAVAALALAGCSTSGGEDADDTTTTEARQTPTTDDGGDTPTTEDGGDTPTTEDGGDEPTDGPSAEELEAILPTTADVGEDWTEDTSDDDDDDADTSDDDLAEQCPDLAALTDDDDEDDEVSRSFTNADDSQLEVTVTPSARQLDADDVTEYVQAINDCGEVTTTDDDGITTTIAFDAAEDDTYSDVGLRIQGQVTLSGAQLPQDIELTIYSLLWRDGPVGVEINLQDGIDTTTFEAIPADTDLALTVADALAPQISDLVG